MVTRRSLRKRQTRLDFTPAASSSPLRPEAHIRIEGHSSPVKKRRITDYTTNSRRLRSGKESFQVVISSPVQSQGQLPTPEPSSQPAIAESEGRDIDLTSDEDVITLKKRNDSTNKVSPTGKIATPRTPTARSFILGGTTGTAPLSRSRPRQLSKSKAKKIVITDGSESSSEDDFSDSSTKFDHSASKNGKTATRRTLRSSSQAKIAGSSENIGSATTNRQLRSASASNSPQILQKRDELGWEFSGTESDDAEPVEVVTPKDASPLVIRPARNSAVVITSGSESSDESNAPITPVRRRVVVSKPPKSVEEPPEPDSELEAELAELRDSESEHTPETSKTRTRGKPQDTKRSQYQSNLDKLKRMRRGTAASIDGEDDEEESDSADEGAHEPLSTSQREHNHSGFEQDGSLLSGEDMDEYEADFVDDDHDENVGVDLVRGGVPLELTSFANMKPYEYFKYEVEWMIHNKLDPAFHRDDEVYIVSRQKLDDEFKGRAGSTFKSSAWTPAFITALTKRPDFSSVAIPILFEDRCDACNRSKHPPKFKVFFSGNKYDEKSLEQIDQDDSEDEASHMSSASQSEVEEDSFQVGRFCYVNAEIAHSLYHWRFQLNLMVLKELSEDGHLTPEKIVQREGWNRKKRERLANKIVDGMDANGDMKRLYDLFRKSLERARTAKPERYERH